MKPAHLISALVFGCLFGALITWLLMRRQPEPEGIQPQVQQRLNELAADKAEADSLMNVAIMGRDSARHSFDSLAALDNTKVIYLHAHERWLVNTSADSVLTYLGTRPTALWDATYPGRHFEDSARAVVPPQ